MKNKSLNKTRNMNIFLNLTKRHFLVFFKDKMRLFYTLMVPLIVLLVYVFFLRQLEVSSASSILNNFKDSYGNLLGSNQEVKKEVSTLIDSWMLSGILAISTLSVSIQTNNIIVNDKENGVNRDFSSSPISKNVLICSYFLFNFLVTLLICFVVLLICLVYMLANNELIGSIDFLDFLIIIGVLILTTILSTLITLFICSFVKKESTLASLIAVISAAAGFLFGAYMPFSMLPNWVRNVCAFFPGTYQTSLFRFAFLRGPIENAINLFNDLKIVSLDGSSSSDLMEQLNSSFGYNLNFFNHEITPLMSLIFVVLCIILFIVLNIIFGSRLTQVAGDKVKKLTKKTTTVISSTKDKIFDDKKSD